MFGLLQLMQSPEAISPHTMKIYRSLARPYITLAEAFEVNDFLKLNAEVEVGQSIWHMVSYESGPRVCLGGIVS